MLKIDSYIIKKIENIYSDEYIPMKIRFGPEKSFQDHLIYWQCGDEHNIIEIGILKKSKELYSITLVNLCNVVLQKYAFVSQPAIDKNSCPLFEIECLDNYYFIEESSVKFYIGNDDITVFFNDGNITNYIMNGDIIFFLDNSDNWIGFNIKTNIRCHQNLIKQCMEQ